MMNQIAAQFFIIMEYPEVKKNTSFSKHCR